MSKHKNYINQSSLYSIIAGFVTNENSLPVLSALVFIGITGVVIYQSLSLTIVVTQKVTKWLTPISDQVNLTEPTIVTRTVVDAAVNPVLTNILDLNPQVLPNYRITNVFYLQHPPDYLTLSFFDAHPFICFIDLSILLLGSLIIAYGFLTIKDIFLTFSRLF